jgi:hypothetical protein
MQPMSLQCPDLIQLRKLLWPLINMEYISMLGMPFNRKAQTKLIAVQGVKVADTVKTDRKHPLGGLKSGGHVRHSSLIRMICKGNYPAISPRTHRAVSIKPSIKLRAIQLSPSFDASLTSRPELDSSVASPRILGQELPIKPITLLETPQKSLVKTQLRVIRVRKRVSASSILKEPSASDRATLNRLKMPLQLLGISNSSPRKVTLVREGDLILSPS